MQIFSKLNFFKATRCFLILCLKIYTVVAVDCCIENELKTLLLKMKFAFLDFLGILLFVAKLRLLSPTNLLFLKALNGIETVVCCLDVLEHFWTKQKFSCLLTSNKNYFDFLRNFCSCAPLIIIPTPILHKSMRNATLGEVSSKFDCFFPTTVFHSITCAKTSQKIFRNFVNFVFQFKFIGTRPN